MSTPPLGFKDLLVFNGWNWSSWEPQFMMYMDSLGLDKAFAGTDIVPSLTSSIACTATKTLAIEQKELREKQAIGYLHLGIIPSLVHIFSAATTAKDKWDILVAKYGKPGTLTTFLLFQQLIQIQFVESLSFKSQLEDHLALRQRAEDAGIKITEQHFVFLLLLALPNSYSNLSTNLLQQRTDTTTLRIEDFQSLILKEKACWCKDYMDLGRLRQEEQPWEGGTEVSSFLI